MNQASVYPSLRLLKSTLWALGLAALLAGCSSAPPRRESSFTFRDGSSEALLLRAEARARPRAAKVLAMARQMTVDERTIVKGSCWDYVNTVWNRADFPLARRHVVFRSAKKGPYAKADLIMPGDWLYFINHSYHDVEHSSLFIDWSNKKTRHGILLSYAGEGRKEPARYKDYDLRSVYQIIRAGD